MKTRHTINETAKIMGISRSTLYKKFLNTGRLSRKKDEFDVTFIDASEIARVCSSADFNAKGKKGSNFKDVDKTSENEELLQKRIDIIQESNAALIQANERTIKILMQELEKKSNEVERLQAILEYKPFNEKKSKSSEGLLLRLAKAVIN